MQARHLLGDDNCVVTAVPKMPEKCKRPKKSCLGSRLTNCIHGCLKISAKKKQDLAAVGIDTRNPPIVPPSHVIGLRLSASSLASGSV